MSYAIIKLLLTVIDLYMIVIFAWVISSWLVSFGIMNLRNPFMRNVVSILETLVEPVVRPIRKIIPAMGGLDLSPIVVLIGLGFIRNVVVSYAATGSLI